MADPFQPKFVDLVRNNTTTQGTGNFVLGAPGAGFTSFTAALQPGDSFYYSVMGVDKPAEREVGRGTLQANGSISRSPIAGALTNFSNGTKTIALIAAAEWYGIAQQLMAAASRFPAVVPDRAALAGYSTTTTAFLREPGREGMFVWNGSNQSANVAADAGQGLYVAAGSDPTGVSGAWVRKYPGGVNVKWFGATGDGTSNDAAAFVAAVACLKSQAMNAAGGGFYKGSPKLFIPAGHYFLGTTTLDVGHTLIIEGEGSGRAPSPAYGCTHLRWANGCDGIRAQAPNTSGTITVDGSTHDGSAGVYISNLTLEGGFTGTEGDYHGIRARSGIYLTDVLIRNWSGDGVHMWTGNVSGNSPPNYAGNVSLARLIGVKSEGNRTGFDIRGTDSNVVTLINCESYQCRQAGVIDDNGAGTNTYMGHHAASNGVVTGAWAQTQCSYSGNHYALKWGGDPTVPPSGDTTDTANWFYIEAGAAITNLIPAWVNTPGTFRAGGDYLTINSASSYLVNCYSEYGSFSQFTASTRIDEGTIGDQYFRGGTRINSGSSGIRVRQSPNAALTLQHHSSEGDLLVQDEANVVHSRILFSKSFGNFHGARDVSGHVFQTAPYNGLWTTRCSITTNGIELPSGHIVTVNGVRVVGARQTGTPADATDLATTLTLVNALKAKLIAHGLIA